MFVIIFWTFSIWTFLSMFEEFLFWESLFPCRRWHVSCSQPGSQGKGAGVMQQGASMTVTTHGRCRTCAPRLRAAEAVRFHQHPGLLSTEPLWHWDTVMGQRCPHRPAVGMSCTLHLPSFEPSFPALLEIPVAFHNFFFCLNQKSTYIREMQMQTMRYTRDGEKQIFLHC